ncbi:unnamed protein product [Vitrella brassicaformis CCMP3155]|uniref:Uncharacterized protein n=7 Tax=Vitrella brassicaformis TaxID=1169539 RepID=A0A0G4GHW2_VITBC|nr:unnamed protein product [Vitrella brassicaformis CCMP3155]|eukprot:CEM29343.1 unnamed protein product [Vitrella brassicaformis CCMP3155]
MSKALVDETYKKKVDSERRPKSSKPSASTTPRVRQSPKFGPSEPPPPLPRAPHPYVVTAQYSAYFYPSIPPNCPPSALETLGMTAIRFSQKVVGHQNWCNSQSEPRLPTDLAIEMCQSLDELPMRPWAMVAKYLRCRLVSNMQRLTEALKGHSSNGGGGGGGPVEAADIELEDDNASLLGDSFDGFECGWDERGTGEEVDLFGNGEVVKKILKEGEAKPLRGWPYRGVAVVDLAMSPKDVIKYGGINFSSPPPSDDAHGHAASSPSRMSDLAKTDIHVPLDPHTEEQYQIVTLQITDTVTLNVITELRCGLMTMKRGERSVFVFRNAFHRYPDPNGEPDVKVKPEGAWRYTITLKDVLPPHHDRHIPHPLPPMSEGSTDRSLTANTTATSAPLPHANGGGASVSVTAAYEQLMATQQDLQRLFEQLEWLCRMVLQMLTDDTGTTGLDAGGGEDGRRGLRDVLIHFLEEYYIQANQQLQTNRDLKPSFFHLLAMPLDAKENAKDVRPDGTAKPSPDDKQMEENRTAFTEWAYHRGHDKAHGDHSGLLRFAAQGFEYKGVFFRLVTSESEWRFIQDQIVLIKQALFDNDTDPCPPLLACAEGNGGRLIASPLLPLSWLLGRFAPEPPMPITNRLPSDGPIDTVCVVSRQDNGIPQLDVCRIQADDWEHFAMVAQERVGSELHFFPPGAATVHGPPMSELFGQFCAVLTSSGSAKEGEETSNDDGGGVKDDNHPLPWTSDDFVLAFTTPLPPYPPSIRQQKASDGAPPQPSVEWAGDGWPDFDERTHDRQDTIETQEGGPISPFDERMPRSNNNNTNNSSSISPAGGLTPRIRNDLDSFLKGEAGYEIIDHLRNTLVNGDGIHVDSPTPPTAPAPLRPPPEAPKQPGVATAPSPRHGEDATPPSEPPKPQTKTFLRRPSSSDAVLMNDDDKKSVMRRHFTKGGGAEGPPEHGGSSGSSRGSKKGAKLRRSFSAGEQSPTETIYEEEPEDGGGSGRKGAQRRARRPLPSPEANIARSHTPPPPLAPFIDRALKDLRSLPFVSSSQSLRRLIEHHHIRPIPALWCLLGRLLSVPYPSPHPSDAMLVDAICCDLVGMAVGMVVRQLMGMRQGGISGGGGGGGGGEGGVERLGWGSRLFEEEVTLLVTEMLNVQYDRSRVSSADANRDAIRKHNRRKALNLCLAASLAEAAHFMDLPLNTDQRFLVDRVIDTATASAPLLLAFIAEHLHIRVNEGVFAFLRSERLKLKGRPVRLTGEATPRRFDDDMPLMPATPTDPTFRMAEALFETTGPLRIEETFVRSLRLTAFLLPHLVHPASSPSSPSSPLLSPPNPRTLGVGVALGRLLHDHNLDLASMIVPFISWVGSTPRPGGLPPLDPTPPPLNFMEPPAGGEVSPAPMAAPLPPPSLAHAIPSVEVIPATETLEAPVAGAAAAGDGGDSPPFSLNTVTMDQPTHMAKAWGDEVTQQGSALTLRGITLTRCHSHSHPHEYGHSYGTESLMSLLHCDHDCPLDTRPMTIRLKTVLLFWTWRVLQYSRSSRGGASGGMVSDLAPWGGAQALQPLLPIEGRRSEGGASVSGGGGGGGGMGVGHGHFMGGSEFEGTVKDVIETIETAMKNHSGSCMMLPPETYIGLAILKFLWRLQLRDIEEALRLLLHAQSLLEDLWGDPRFPGSRGHPFSLFISWMVAQLYINAGEVSAAEGYIERFRALRLSFPFCPLPWTLPFKLPNPKRQQPPSVQASSPQPDPLTPMASLGGHSNDNQPQSPAAAAAAGGGADDDDSPLAPSVKSDFAQVAGAMRAGLGKWGEAAQGWMSPSVGRRQLQAPSPSSRTSLMGLLGGSPKLTPIQEKHARIPSGEMVLPPSRVGHLPQRQKRRIHVPLPDRDVGPDEESIATNVSDLLQEIPNLKNWLMANHPLLHSSPVRLHIRHNAFAPFIPPRTLWGGLPLERQVGGGGGGGGSGGGMTPGMPGGPPISMSMRVNLSGGSVPPRPRPAVQMGDKSQVPMAPRPPTPRKSVVAGSVYTFGENSNGELGLGRPLIPDKGESQAKPRHTAQAAAKLLGQSPEPYMPPSDGPKGLRDCVESGGVDVSWTGRPAKVVGLKDVEIVEVACGDASSAAIDREGCLYVWGQNVDSQLGIAPTSRHPGDLSAPEAATPPAHFSSLTPPTPPAPAAAPEEKSTKHDPKRDEDDNQPPTARAPHHLNFIAVPLCVNLTLDVRFKAIACGNGFAIALTINGDAFSWGVNTRGQLGLGDFQPRHTPTQIPAALTSAHFNQLEKVACGAENVIALTGKGQLFVWGAGHGGQLGVPEEKFAIAEKAYGGFPGDIRCLSRPERLRFFTTQGDPMGPLVHLAIDHPGTQTHTAPSQLGSYGSMAPSVPVSPASRSVRPSHKPPTPPRMGAQSRLSTPPRTPPQGHAKLNKQTSRIFILTEDHADITKFVDPQPTASLRVGSNPRAAKHSRGERISYRDFGEYELKFDDVAAGEAHCLVIDRAGIVWAWGATLTGQCGHGYSMESGEYALNMEVGYQRFPMAIPPFRTSWGLEKAWKVSAGGNLSACITDRGTLFMWGNNDVGQLPPPVSHELPAGLPRTPVTPAPSIVSRPTRVEYFQDLALKSVACGGDHVVAIDVTGQAYSWGSNGWGRLGHSATTRCRAPPPHSKDKAPPAKLEGFEGVGVRKVACGPTHTLLLTGVGGNNPPQAGISRYVYPNYA